MDFNLPKKRCLQLASREGNATPLLLAYTKPAAADYIPDKWKVSDYHAGEISSRWVIPACIPGAAKQCAYIELLPEWPEDIADYIKATDIYENDHTTFWATSRAAWRTAYAALRVLRKHGRVTITGATEGLYLLNCSPAHHITFTGKGL